MWPLVPWSSGTIKNLLLVIWLCVSYRRLLRRVELLLGRPRNVKRFCEQDAIKTNGTPTREFTMKAGYICKCTAWPIFGREIYIICAARDVSHRSRFVRRDWDSRVFDLSACLVKVIRSSNRVLRSNVKSWLNQWRNGIHFHENTCYTNVIYGLCTLKLELFTTVMFIRTKIK